MAKVSVLLDIHENPTDTWYGEYSIARNISNTGTYSWVIPKQILRYGEFGTRYDDLTGKKYKIMISDERDSNPRVFDQSDSLFTIKQSLYDGQPPVITGISGPSQLQVGQTGTWTVSAYDPEQGNLSYSVDWNGGKGVAAQNMPSEVKQTATFTHSYSSAGTYTPTFTITDSQGLTAQSSLSVAVGVASNAEVSINVEAPFGNYNIEPGSGGIHAGTVSLQAEGRDSYLRNLYFEDKLGGPHNGSITRAYLYDESNSVLLASSYVSGSCKAAGPNACFEFSNLNLRLRPIELKKLSVRVDSSAKAVGSRQFGLYGASISDENYMKVPTIFRNMFGSVFVFSGTPTLLPVITVLSPGKDYVWKTGTNYLVIWKSFSPTSDTYVYLNGGGHEEGYSKFIGNPSHAANNSIMYTPTNADLPIGPASWKILVCDGKLRNGGENCGLSEEFRIISSTPSPTKLQTETNQTTSVNLSQMANTLQSAQKMIEELFRILRDR